MKKIERTVENLLSYTRTMPNGCMEWTTGKDKDGYGITCVNRKIIRAHRLIMILLGNDVAGKHVCHRCDNPPCINPDHLFVGTAKDNKLDSVKKGRSKNINLSTKNGMCDLCEEEIIEIFTTTQTWAQAKETAQKKNIGIRTISAILRGKSHASITSKYKSIYKRKGGPVAGEKNTMAKIGSDEAMQIFKDNSPLSKVSRKFNVSPSLVWRIRHGYTWSHVTGLPKRSERKKEA